MFGVPYSSFAPLVLKQQATSLNQAMSAFELASLRTHANNVARRKIAIRNASKQGRAPATARKTRLCLVAATHTRERNREQKHLGGQQGALSHQRPGWI